MRTVRVDFSKAKRKRGRPHRTSEHESHRVRRLLRYAEEQLKAAGWRYGFRQEAERQVVEELIRRGYDEKWARSYKFGARRRGKKKGGLRSARCG